MTRQAAPVRPPVVLSIAGSDSGGGAGIQADLKTIEAGGAFGTTAITNVTAQHTHGVESTHPVPVPEIEAQLDAVLGDYDVAAVKTGMLGTAAVVETVVDYAAGLPNLVVDPVMVAASGDRLLESDAESAYADLVAESALVTPNADEAEALTGVEVTDVDAAIAAGERLVEMGAGTALVTGGHVPGDDVVDALVTPEYARTVRHERVDADATHGSGCTLSAAVATRLAHGDALADAVTEGVTLLASAVRYTVDVGDGPGSVHHQVRPRNEAARPETEAGVETVVAALRDRDVDGLIPPDGTNVVGATPYAEVPGDVAAVDGGLGRTVTGLRANRGVTFGTDGRLGRLLLAVREVDPTARFALDCRDAPAVREVVDPLDGDVVSLAEPVAGNDTLAGRLEASKPIENRPAAVVDDHDGTVTLVAPTPGNLVDRLDSVAGAV